MGEKIDKEKDLNYCGFKEVGEKECAAEKD